MMRTLSETSLKSLPPTVIQRLLQDKTSGNNILWATNDYKTYGEVYSFHQEIQPNLITKQHTAIILPRALKAANIQELRTKARAEVFTPAWLCNQMNNHCDEEWFGYEDVFNTQVGHLWFPKKHHVHFPSPHRSWTKYVDSRRLEITCGEAPFLVSRYDAATGEAIEIPYRVGILDRKLRVVNENAQDEREWLKWATRAVQSCYGYEYQGDSLFLARLNVLLTFSDYFKHQWNRNPTQKELLHIANIIAWNLWQMDGVNGHVPGTTLAHHRPAYQFTLFDEEDDTFQNSDAIFCKLFDWRSNKSIMYPSLQQGGFCL